MSRRRRGIELQVARLKAAHPAWGDDRVVVEAKRLYTAVTPPSAEDVLARIVASAERQRKASGASNVSKAVPLMLAHTHYLQARRALGK